MTFTGDSPDPAPSEADLQAEQAIDTAFQQMSAYAEFLHSNGFMLQLDNLAASYPDEPLLDYYRGYVEYRYCNAGQTAGIWRSIRYFDAYMGRCSRTRLRTDVLKMQGENYRQLVLAGEDQYRITSGGFFGAYLFYQADDAEARKWFNEMME